MVDISSVVRTTCRELHSLKVTIGDDLSVVNNEAVGNIVGELHKTLNTLVRELNQSSKPLELGLKKDLFSLMQEIQKTPAFSQALGPHQVELMNLFKRIHAAVSKAESKVTRVDLDRLSK